MTKSATKATVMARQFASRKLVSLRKASVARQGKAEAAQTTSSKKMVSDKGKK